MRCKNGSSRSRAVVTGALWPGAVVGVPAGLKLDSTSPRSADAATRLTDARYGALGVLGQGRHLSNFVHIGSFSIGPAPGRWHTVDLTGYRCRPSDPATGSRSDIVVVIGKQNLPRT
jgi:hypothetical protein